MGRGGSRRGAGTEALRFVAGNPQGRTGTWEELPPGAEW